MRELSQRYDHSVIPHSTVSRMAVVSPETICLQDGFETVIVANHFGHFLLTNLLLPELEKSRYE